MEGRRGHGNGAPAPIAASIIPEHVWTRLYIKGLTPDQAANAAELKNHCTRSPGPDQS
jgi:hypothetical protein